MLWVLSGLGLNSGGIVRLTRTARNLSNSVGRGAISTPKDYVPNGREAGYRDGLRGVAPIGSCGSAVLNLER